jgi:hypothetical protein
VVVARHQILQWETQINAAATMPLNKKNLKLLELRLHKLLRHSMGLPLREVAHHQELELVVLITKL